MPYALLKPQQECASYGARRPKYRSVMLAGALGDAIGFHVETKPRAAVAQCVQLVKKLQPLGDLPHFPDFPLTDHHTGALLKSGQVSDDSQLALCVMAAYQDQRFCTEAFTKALLAAEQEGIVGIGSTTQKALSKLKEGTSWLQSGCTQSESNGAVMRVGVVGVLAKDDAKAVIADARQQAVFTHAKEICQFTSAFLALAVWQLARKNIPLESLSAQKSFWDDVMHPLAQGHLFNHPLLEMAEQGRSWLALEPAAAVAKALELDADMGAKPWFEGLSTHCMSGTLWALYAFLKSPDDLFATYARALEAGGDTDSFACMSGYLLGARHGDAILPRWLSGWLHDRGVPFSDKVQRLYQSRHTA